MKDGRNTIEISDPGALPEQPLVSVYMLAYRHERFIAEAIEGVIAQEGDFSIELIIGEDCSPDRTRNIALEYQKKYSRLIRVITSDANVGAPANSARCRAACRGKYIAICEGDDYWSDSTKLARQIEIFRAHPKCALVFHAAAYVDSQTGDQTRTSKQSLFSRMLSVDEIIVGDGGLIPTASILVRREIALDMPLWCLQAPVGDYPLVLRAALLGKIAYLDRVMSIYRTNVPCSWTQRHLPEINSRMQYAQRIEAMFSGFSIDSGHRFDRATREIISKYYSDPLVRLPYPVEEKRDIYDKVSGKLRGSDRWLTWLAVKYGLRLPLLKDLLRKSRSLFRLIKVHVLSERIAANPRLVVNPLHSEKRHVQ